MIANRRTSNERICHLQDDIADDRDRGTEVPSKGRHTSLFEESKHRLRAAANSFRRLIQMNRRNDMSVARYGFGIQRLLTPTPPPIPVTPLERALARLEAELRAAQDVRDDANIRWMQSSYKGDFEETVSRRVAYYQAVATCNRLSADINVIREEMAR